MTLAELSINDGSVRKFQESWSIANDPDLERFLPDPSEPSFLGTLFRLVVLDLEFRWKQYRQISNLEESLATQSVSGANDSESGESFRVEYYLNRFPMLEEDELVRSLVREEFIVRRRFGDFPSVSEYHDRFPKYSEMIDELGEQHGSLLSSSLGQFRLIEKLGSGAYGTVWKAEDSRLERMVAIKVPHGWRMSEQDRERFLREARTSAQLHHPNIVTVHEVGHQNSVDYLVSDFIDGQTLEVWLRNRQLSPNQSVRLMRQLTNALEYAHAEGVVHRDLKPGNILIDSDQQLYVMDFGLAKTQSVDVTMTVDGQILGTPAYMSPEQAAGNSQRVDRRSDIYSLGVILFELLTGERPFRGNSQRLMQQIQSTDPQSPRNLSANVPKDLETICLKCLARETDRRYQSVKELDSDLENWQERRPIRARPVGIVEKAWLWCRRRPRLIVTTVAITILFVSLAIWFNQIRIQVEAKRLVQGTLQADPVQLQYALDRMNRYRTWTDPILNQQFEQLENGTSEKLHAAIALLDSQPELLPYIADQIQKIPLSRVPTLLPLVKDQTSQLIEELQPILIDSDADPELRSRVAGVLVQLDPNREGLRESDLIPLLVDRLTTSSPSQLVIWQQLLYPVRTQLLEPLSKIYRDDKQPESTRNFAGSTLMNFLDEDFAEKFQVYLDAEKGWLSPMLTLVANHKREAIFLAEQTLDEPFGADESSSEIARLERRHAHAALLLLKLKRAEKVWPIFGNVDKPGIESFLIDRVDALDLDGDLLVEHYRDEQDNSVKAGIVRCLGYASITKSLRRPFVERLLVDFVKNPDPGLHSAIDWFLRKKKATSYLEKATKKIKLNKMVETTDNGPTWYMDKQGHTFAVFNATDFIMGSADRGPVQVKMKRPHRRVIGLRLAVASREVTRQQWYAFKKAVPDAYYFTKDQKRVYAPKLDSPMPAVTWYDATRYCNWLSEQNGIPKDEWCYEPNKKGEYAEGMTAKDEFWNLTGYRLPTDGEWEFACRAGTGSECYFGSSELLSDRYVWALENTTFGAKQVGRKIPNPLGLFDILGNLSEWCFDPVYSLPQKEFEYLLDSPPNLPVSEKLIRCNRGGSFNTSFRFIRSTQRSLDIPGIRMLNTGFRPVRTIEVLDEFLKEFEDEKVDEIED